MKKILRFSFVALMAMICGTALADDYVLYSGEISEGDYIIYYDGKAMNTTVDKNRLQFLEVTPENDKISNPDAAIVWKIAKNGDYYTLYNSSASKYAASTGTKNQATVTETVDDKALWTISGEETYEIVNKGNAAANVNSNLRNNGTYGFACYSTNTGGALSLYKKKEAGQNDTKTETIIVFSDDYMTKFTPGKDGDKVTLPTATVKAGDAAVAGATVTWSLTKGSNWSADSEPVINGTKVELGDHSRGDLTLKASYAGNDTYEASSKSYTLKVYKGYMAIKSILEDYPEVGGDTWTAKEAEWKAGVPVSYWQVEAKSETEFTSKEALVTYVNGSYTYIKDDFGSLLLYGNNLGLKKGDIITGDLGNDKGYGAIYGTLKAYNGLLELAVNKEDIEFIVKSSDNTVEPKTVTIDQLNQANMNEYVKIENAEYVTEFSNKNATFKVGNQEFTVRQNWTDVSTEGLEVGAKYTLEGMGCIYYKDNVVTNQLYLTSFTKTAESGINTIKANSFSGAIYNLKGQRVQTMSRGLYIKDGKKFFVK